MKSFISFIIICLYVLGAVGGFGYALYSGANLIGIAIIALAVMAWPTVRNAFKELTE